MAEILVIREAATLEAALGESEALLFKHSPT
jgi:hypothetical protein